MIQPKKLAGYAVFGLVLSFLISLISTHKVGTAIIRGFIFAALFAGISALIQLVEDKFLDVGESDLGTGPLEPKIGVKSSSGNKVDITITDENLTDDAQGPAFSVDTNRHALDNRDTKASVEKEKLNESVDNMSDAGENMNNIPVAKAMSSSTSSLLNEVVGKSEVSADDDVSDIGNVSNITGMDTAGTEESKEFKPIKLGTPLTAAENQAAPDTSKMSRKAALAAERQAAKQADIAEIGSLPDISDYVPETKVDSGDIIDDSDFAETVDNTGPSASSSSPDISDMQSKDVETMAAAIRTLLKKDE